ncbi:MAG: Glycosyltransferase [Nitrospira sp.]|jgi:dolichol-phosphate mannosyltransferase|nr:MAG: Glycosyltransferase [Nitrospira sp.]
MPQGLYAEQEPDSAVGSLLSVVVPVYNEREGLQEFYDRTKRVLLDVNGLDHEIIFVDDGSCDGSAQVITQFVGQDARVRLLKLSRNFGHQIAITAGIDAARGHAVVVIDADLQDPPEVIVRFIEKWKEGYDVVYGVRETRDGETLLKVWTASIFYRILKALINLDIPVDVGDFRLMSRRVVEHLKAMQERDRFVRGLVSWIGFMQIGLTYHRDKRYAGETKYPYRKMIRFALDGITSFSSIPLKMATIMGYLTSLVAFAYACSVIVQKFMGYTVQGWATIMVGLLFLGGVQLICLGILGEYIGRIFNETKGRPLYIIDHEARSDRPRYGLPDRAASGSFSKD